jgi:hypothetical protein
VKGSFEYQRVCKTTELDFVAKSRFSPEAPINQDAGYWALLRTLAHLKKFQSRYYLV